jgi:hypothetical protein
MDLPLHLLGLFSNFDCIFSGSDRFVGTDVSETLFTIFIVNSPVFITDGFDIACWHEMRHLFNAKCCLSL